MASATATMSITPTFLVSGMAVQISEALHLDPGQLGIAVAGFFGATAVTTSALGRVVARAGARTGLLVVMGVDVVVLLTLASATHIAVLVGALLVAGTANGAVHPASNTLLAQGVQSRLGLALGIKQSSMPAAALMGGLAVPLVALTVGWRWGFVLGAVVAASIFVWVLRLGSGAKAVASGEARGRLGGVRRPWLLSVGAGCGAAAGTSLSVFLVDATVRSGHAAPAAAGLLAASGGFIALLNRAGLGWAQDAGRGASPLVLARRLVMFGALGFVLMTIGPSTLYVIGAAVALGWGFGWTGLVHLAVVGEPSTSAARATGTLMTGFAAGSCLGPLGLGQVSARWGYEPVWMVAACLSLAAGLALYLSGRGGRAPARERAQSLPVTGTDSAHSQEIRE